jgi:hypothetical protein
VSSIGVAIAAITPRKADAATFALLFALSVGAKAELLLFESLSRFSLLFEHDPSGQARGQALSENRFPLFGIRL